MKVRIALYCLLGAIPLLAGALGTAPGMGFMEDQVRQNLALFDRAMKMFSPFAFARTEGRRTNIAPSG